MKKQTIDVSVKVFNPTIIRWIAFLIAVFIVKVQKSDFALMVCTYPIWYGKRRVIILVYWIKVLRIKK